MTRPTRRLITLLIPVSALLLYGWPMAALASTAPGLGTAASYAVLAGSRVTCTGTSVITGDLGVSPGSAVDVSCPGVPRIPPAADPAQLALTTAYNDAASSPCNFDMTGQNLGGLTLTPGTYCQSTAPTLTGTLTLSGNGVFIFQTGSTLVTASGASVVLTDGAQPCNVFWQVGSSATLNTTTTFVGTIMALTDISVNTGANITGRALARNGAVTLDTNHITAPTTCSAVSGPTPAPAASPSASPAASPSASLLASPSASLIASPSAITASPSAGPTPRPVPRLASTGSGPREGLPWMVVLIAGGLGAVGLGLGVRARRRRV